MRDLPTEHTRQLNSALGRWRRTPEGVRGRRAHSTPRRCCAGRGVRMPALLSEAGGLGESTVALPRMPGSLLATHNLLGALPAAANRPGRAHAARLQRACGGAGARRAYGSAPEGGKLNVTRRAHSSCSPLHVTANGTRETRRPCLPGESRERERRGGLFLLLNACQHCEHVQSSEFRVCSSLLKNAITDICSYFIHTNHHDASCVVFVRRSVLP
jgi:hypothetical protein